MGAALRSQVYALLTVMLWSTAYVFTKLALEFFSPGALGLLRCGVATLTFGCVVALGRIPAPRLRDLPLFILSGLCGFTLYMLAFNLGSVTLNPTTNCIVISTTPIITAVLARLAFGEKLRALRWCALALAFGGVVVMNGGGQSFVVAPGIAWVLLAALLVSLYNILQRGLSRKYGALQITAWSFFTGTALLLYFLPDALDQVRVAPARALLLLCFLGVFPSAAAYLCWGKALSLAPRTSLVTNYMFLTSFLALLLEYVVTGGLPGLSTFVGGGIILASLLLFTLAGGAKGGPGGATSAADGVKCTALRP
ncbi:MAG: hypothetical protein BCS36_09610 [Desulfovibrio sp. MES5]|uniref:DMT family transporter n=1 Tax=Desulfovibrio sp. MES5 TaxID=1899016 RepID=UPI000B9D45CC|nr:DMT family transporter [Desulfovibrio sp. MES5]OXS28979.1 MAG: hypothetical protein BCS36_09610 [Desulfovibrio sp. MES5]